MPSDHDDQSNGRRLTGSFTRHSRRHVPALIGSQRNQLREPGAATCASCKTCRFSACVDTVEARDYSRASYCVSGITANLIENPDHPHPVRYSTSVSPRIVQEADMSERRGYSRVLMRSPFGRLVCSNEIVAQKCLSGEVPFVVYDPLSLDITYMDNPILSAGSASLTGRQRYDHAAHKGCNEYVGVELNTKSKKAEVLGITIRAAIDRSYLLDYERRTDGPRPAVSAAFKLVAYGLYVKMNAYSELPPLLRAINLPDYPELFD